MPITTTPSGGAVEQTNTYTPLYATTLSTSASSVTFSSIPSTYTDLVIVSSAQRGISNSGEAALSITFNGDTSSIYSTTLLYESSPYAWRNSNAANIGNVGGVGDGSDVYSVLNINGYSSPSKYKMVIGRFGYTGQARVGVGLWRNNTPITSITFTPANGFASGAQFAIYGIKAAATAPKASGGDIITTDGTYWYHAFKGSGVFDVKQDLTADILVVAGGGGGGYNLAGGGGAGGLLGFTSQSLTSGVTYPVTVGAGAIPAMGYNYTHGANGSNSQFASLTAAVGGGGGNSINSGVAGAVGGSGGGGSYGNNSGGAGTAGQGNAGGNVPGHPAQCGGGGGGAGGAGANGSGFNGGAGGDGVNTYSSWASATNTGASGYFAGGGGGGGDSSPGAGGAGGGGAGASSSDGYAGTANTGGGGGGSRQSGSTRYGGGGGSGIVIVRYAV